LNATLPRVLRNQERKQGLVPFRPVARLASGFEVVPAHVGTTVSLGDDVILCPVLSCQPDTTVDAKDLTYVPTVEVVLADEYPWQIT
jgi:hypothetical protein